MSHAPLRPLHRAPALHHSVQSSLRQFIIDNELKAGDPLPAEATLARQLGIGRNSVREGIKALESVGMIEVRRGVGAFVKAFSLEPLLEHLPFAFGNKLRDVEEILELRQALEVSLIERVIHSISDEGIAQLRQITEVMGAKAARGQNFTQEDRAFHQALFAPLGNAMLLELIETFWRVFDRVSGRSRLETQDPVATYRDHVAIVDAVATRDIAAAKQKLVQHYAGISARLNRQRLTSTSV